MENKLFENRAIPAVMHLAMPAWKAELTDSPVDSDTDSPGHFYFYQENPL
jgi:hypothetical protein